MFKNISEDLKAKTAKDFNIRINKLFLMVFSSPKELKFYRRF